MDAAINKDNVGRIAERIVANELEYRGFRVSDLNKEGTSANADLIAVKDGKPWQIQVKGATNTEKDGGWWFQYGYCNDAVIKDRNEPMFNRHSSFYMADVVVLVAVKSPKDYCCVVLPVQKAEEAAQINLDREYRIPKADGSSKKPAKVWTALDYVPVRTTEARKASFAREQEILIQHRDNWSILSTTQNLIPAPTNVVVPTTPAVPTNGPRE